MTYRTYEEYLRHPSFLAVADQVKERSKGQCESCHRALATEIHHVRYCRWGEFDTAENLLHVCHVCHCAFHQCEQCGRIELKARHIKSGTTKCDRCQ